jgi:FdhD protein
MSPEKAPVARRRWRADGWEEGARMLAEEVPVALSYGGTTEAVMMATPADLEDFGVGFSLTEGLARPGEIEEVAVVAVEGGIDIQITLAPGAGQRLADRRRRMAGPVGCGLCGLDSIAAVARRLAPVPASALALAPAEVSRAMALLPAGQALHGATRAAHAAAFFTPAAGIVALREDVGRHNALDKLTGALVRAGTDPSEGALLLTSRVSIDLVQKVAALGAPVMIAASAPTAHACRLAQATGITLVALARGAGFEVFSRPERIAEPRAADVA